MHQRLSRSGAALLFLAAPVLAQGTWSDEYDRPGLLGRVFALGAYRGDVIAGGLGIQADGRHLGLVARFDGARWRPMASPFPSGDPNQIRAILELGDDVVVGGLFSQAGGGVAAQSIAKWNGASWSPLGAGVAGKVWSLAIYEGELYVGGTFGSAGGVPARNVARWDGASWSAVGQGLDHPSEPIVQALHVGADGRLYASGQFLTSGGTSVSGIAAWDGSVWSPVGGGFDLPGGGFGYVWDLETYGGELYACANFDLVPGGQPHEKIARWNGSTWAAAGNFPDSEVGTAVNALEVFGGFLYAGGSIVSASGVSVRRFARFDGAQWSYAGGVTGGTVPSTVIDLLALGGTLVAGGEFDQALPSQDGSTIVTHSIAAFDGSTWSGVGEGHGFNAMLRKAVVWNGQPVVFGGFTQAGAHLASAPVQFDGERWLELGEFEGNAPALGIVFEGDLVVAGGFTSVDGQPAAGVARFDGTSWEPLGTTAPPLFTFSTFGVHDGFLHLGGLGGVARWDGTSWVDIAPSFNGWVFAMQSHQGVLFVGGMLGSHGNVAYWDGSAFQPVGAGTNGTVYALESLGDELIVGGEFTTVGGAPAHGLARFDGITLEPFPGLTGTIVQSLAIFQGELHAAGNLFVPGSADKYIARWDGSAWRALGGGLFGQAQALAPDDVGGHLYAAGLITLASDQPSWYFARWDSESGTLGTPYCTSAPNSAGAGAQIHASGSAEVAQNDFTLMADGLPPRQPGMFFFGTQALELPFGDGVRCAGGTVRRLGPPAPADGAGVAIRVVDLDAPPAAGVIVSGTTFFFQHWYRDPFAGMSGFNLSNGLEVDFH